MNRSFLALSAVVSVIAAPARASAQQAEKQGWQWSTDTVMKVVNAVRAGRTLQPKSWPNGAHVAVALSFDVDNETVNLRFGQPTVGELSQGQYGARTGLPRIVALLDRESIPATFFIPAVSLMIDRSQADLIKRSGRHEFGVHGWIHEMNTALPADIERRLVQQALDTLTAITGKRPVGYRAPSWNFSPATMSIVRDLGFRYESSLMADERPYELTQDGKATGVVELPVEWIMDDAPLFSPRGTNYANPRDVAQVWIDEFDRAYEEGSLFLLTMHPHVSGHRSRVKALELLIAHMKAKPGVWYATHEAVAEYVRSQAGMK
ncbi:MAG: polysaccharide deacetylase [Gemmatimonadaceae bacterium]